MNEIWRTLGIDPTQDVVAIKKAYASRLKRTRPDDDAQAYQALRTAYDVALHLARTGPVMAATTAPQDASEASIGAPPPGTEDGEPLAKEPAEQAEPNTDRYIPPRDLAHQTLAHLRESGPQALVAAWPLLEQQLDRLPLRERGEASNWFAQLLIEIDPFPPPFAEALARYFGWEGDYRSEQVLGVPRAMALRQRLSELREAFYPDDAFRQHYGIVGFYGFLVQQLPAWKLRLFTLLAPSRLRAAWQELGPKHRYALGVKPDLHARADAAIDQSAALRLILILAIGGLLARRPEAFAEQSALVRVIAAFMFGGAGYLAALLLANICSEVRRWIRSHAQPLVSWGRRFTPTRIAWCAWTALPLATGICAFMESGVLNSTLLDHELHLHLIGLIVVLLLVGLVTPALPAGRNGVAWLMTWVACVAIAAMLPPWTGFPLTALLSGTTWFMAAALTHVNHAAAIEPWFDRLHAGADGAPGRPVVRWLLNVLRNTIGWPYQLLNLARSHSGRFVVAIVGLSLATLPPSWSAWLLPYMVLLTWAMLRVERLVQFFSFKALVPGNEAQPKLGWAGLAGLVLWLPWALMCLLMNDAVAGRLGLAPATHPLEAAVVHLWLGLGLPYLGLVALMRLRMTQVPTAQAAAS